MHSKSISSEIFPQPLQNTRKKRRVSVQALVLIALFAVTTFGLAKQQQHLDELINWISSAGAAAPWLFMIIAAGLSVLGIPRLLIFTMAGMIFGFYEGLALSLVATLAGSYLVFALVRRRSGWIIKGVRWSLVTRMSESIKQGGITSVLFIRQLPLAGFYNNALLGLSCVSYRDFMLGSLIGFLPAGVPSAMLGADMLHVQQLSSFKLLLIGLVFSSMTYGFRWILCNKKSPLYKKRPAWLVSSENQKAAKAE